VTRTAVSVLPPAEGAEITTRGKISIMSEPTLPNRVPKIKHGILAPMRTYFLALLVLAFLLVFHSLGISQNFYLYFWPYDIIAHIMGGLGIGLFIAAFFRTYQQGRFKEKAKVIVPLVFLVGLGWEVFEVYFNIAGNPYGTKAYFIDTIKDLIDDTLGGIIAVYIDRLLYK
jgi:hypothetical protein